ncbi:TPA: restriction endonuclease subunit S [Streptococcus agalactiae]|uniref:restriction endonuclease subunit S n=2 Tax=Streptococcus agalactiae TaxID=1311 RepID=UPI0002BB5B43|nr:restriction endonuclease subunit S [Streptococcus agalactiae]EPU90836.1 type I restriction endonuclease subunit S [Streptococcus agalactiae GB00245]EPV66891.1 type I restriction endonuclease subunit S [Streptococcus agalactiae GB00932]KAF0082030.1 restriction endonuclease subunit S [Streptococcus agalactiae]KLK53727.1 type I restriction modification protein [Streptococcus agalactiae]MCW1801215.1 restriction endonuclease subunit S [Streptococcus agalactiae]
MTPEQLKASILQRAMEGKLVPQDPTDEPASELLKRIKAEKENLIADGKIKRDKKETELFRGADGKPYEKLADGTIQEVEVPYEIPESWNWVKLRNIGSITSGGTPKSSEPSYYGGNITWITPADMGKQQNNKFFAKSSKKITELGLQKSSAQLISKNSIVYSSRAPIGHINIVTEDYTTNQGCKSITPLLVDLIFLYWLLQFRTKDIILRSSGTTFKEISASGFGDTLLPLPPLAEQKRIVAQIEKALAKVDEYAESYNKLQQLDKEFPDKLKKSILQYAMQGKLVAQSPDDEPVEVLLEKIKAEKQKLYEEGKLKKKDLEELVVTKGDDNSPYRNSKKNSDFVGSTMAEIPNSWSYVKFGSIVTFNIGKTPPRNEPTYWGNDIPWVSISDMPSSGHITKTKECISHLAIKQTNIKIVPADTLLMSFKLSIGKVAILDVPASHNEAIISIFPYSDKKNIIRNYLMMFLPLISTAGNSKDAIKGKTLNSTSISELLIPISNYREMKKIVSKVDLLFQKVAQLSD